jgi:hypothetical protein
MEDWGHVICDLAAAPMMPFASHAFAFREGEGDRSLIWQIGAEEHKM